MKNTVKDIGKLSTKLFTALVLAGIVSSGYATDNSIYVDQSGDFATIGITQDGASNQVRGVAGAKDTPAKLYGDGLTLDVVQTGSGNALQLGIQTGQAGGVSSSVKYHVTGNSATAVIDMNNLGATPSLANAIDVNQVGDTANAEIHMTGSNNYMRVIQSGGNNNSFVAQVHAGATDINVNQTGGGGNSTTLQLSSDKGTVDVITVGASNTIDINQQGTAGINGHYAKVDLNGSSNTVSILQNGSIDMTTNIKSAGNSNSFTIIQRN